MSISKSSQFRLIGLLVIERVVSLIRWPGTAIGILALFLSSFAAISTSLIDLRDQRAQYVAEVQQRVLAQVRPPGLAAGRSTESALRVVRPPNPAAVLIGGPGVSLPAYWDMAPAGLEAGAPYQSPRSRVGGHLALATETVLRLFGALLGLTLTLWAALRDIGRAWPQVSSRWSLRPAKVVVATLIGDAMVMAAVVVVWFGGLAAYLMIWAGGDAPLWHQWLLLAIPTWAHLLFFSGLGGAIAYAFSTPSRALSAAVSAWLIVAVLLPQGLLYTDTWFEDSEPLAITQREMKEQHADLTQEVDERAGDAISAAVIDAASPEERTTQATDAFRRVESEWRTGIADVRRMMYASEDDYWNTVTRRRELMAWLARLNPATAYSASLSAATGSGLAYVESWEIAVRNHKRRLDATLFDDKPIVNLDVTFGTNRHRMAFTRKAAVRYDNLPVFEPPQPRSRFTDAVKDGTAQLIQTIGMVFASGYLHLRLLKRYRRLGLSAKPMA